MGINEETIKTAFREAFSEDYLRSMEGRSTPDVSLVEVLYMAFASGFREGSGQATPEERTARTKVFLKSLTSERTLTCSNAAPITARFLVVHDNETATVDQILTLRRTDAGWTAEMPMDDFPAQKTVTAAAWKLADWMERMAAAIREAAFDEINLNNLL